MICVCRVFVSGVLSYILVLKVLPDILVARYVTTSHNQCLFIVSLSYRSTMYGIFLCIMTSIRAGTGNSRFPDEVIREYPHDAGVNEAEVSS